MSDQVATAGVAHVEIFFSFTTLRKHPTNAFTGRGDVLRGLVSYFAGYAEERRIYLLHGLGGSGKTQIVLKFIDAHSAL